MINHTKQYERVEDTFKEVQKEYQIFKKNVSYANRNKLKLKIDEHREAINNLVASVNNIFFK